ncbi:MAG TPA: FimV/HubP family polar landmark protein [Steroidobacteraceae bacterium]|nr:FimV/HubP family polar landmark protein [Steroidobacteraceae bacterium]
MPRLVLVACLSALTFVWPASSFALGLGEIHLNSALNEPLAADIDLIAASPDELAALRANLAGRDAFTRYGIDRPAFLSNLTFKVGKSKEGHDALLVRSTDAISEPFVTFLVEVNWARGRLMREYTVLLDPPVYTPGESASNSAPVSAPTGTAQAPRPAAAGAAATAPSAASPRASARSSSAGAESGGASSGALNGGTYTVGSGDTLTKVARSLRAGSPGDVDQAMIALYRANPDAFGGNINILRRGAVLRIPGADQIAALNQSEAMSEVHRQMSEWRSGAGAESQGHLRLVTPGAGGAAATPSVPSAPAGNTAALGNENQALRERVKELESQVAESHRLIDIRNGELSALQRKLSTQATPPTAAPPPTPAQPPAASTPSPAVPTPAPTPAASAAAPEVTPAPAPVPVPPPAAQKKPSTSAESGSWIDWIAEHWWVPAAVIVALILVLFVAAQRRRQGALSEFDRVEDTGITDLRAPKATGARREDSFVVEESGEHRQPTFEPAVDHSGDTSVEMKPSEDTLSSESAVNLDQGDPLAEADFHMAYGLYDQAADLVRIALEREPDRRDLRLKLLEIYFVWGNKDAFLQTAKELEASRDRAPAGEWDKIVIMGRQIAPDDPMFSSTAGSGRGAGALVDLNLEGGENRVDIDLFGEPGGERSRLENSLAKDGDDTASTGESPRMHAGSDLDFTLDAPERGADDSPTREMPPRDEPTVESELMFNDTPTAESPTLSSNDLRDRISSKLPGKADQTAEVSIDDLGLDLDHDHLEETDQPAPIGSDLDTGTHSSLEETDHPSDAPTMVAGLDDKSRRMMAEAESRSRDRDLTELERELEASFIADLGEHEDAKTAVMGPESAPTVQMPRDFDVAATSRFDSAELSALNEADKVDVDSTSKLKGLSGDSIDLDLDHLANALGSGDTVEQPRSADEMFSSEVFEASQRSRRVDLDVGESLTSSEAVSSSEASTNKLQAISQTSKTTKIKGDEMSELEPVTMSEVGTKLDLARAYMDMGDPEGARSILEEVVQEGSASQKQEAQRLIETLPG